MQTRILRNSTASQVGAGQRLWVWYAGELLDGTPFDANFSFATFTALPQRTPFSFILGAGEVIRGWDEALTGQRLGRSWSSPSPAHSPTDRGARAP